MRCNRRTHLLIQKALLASLLLISYNLCFAESQFRLSYEGQSEKVKRSVSLMTTLVEFVVVTDNKEKANKAIDEAIDEFHRIESLMSEWKPSSQISVINKQAYQMPVQVEEEVYRLLEASLKLSEVTEGKFDITFASAGKLWDFRNAKIPSEQAIESARQSINYQFVELDADERQVRFSRKGTKVGLGGIAKGYAVDRAVQIIKQYGFSEFSINAGGDLFVVGKHDAGLWRVGIQHPRITHKNIAILPVANAAVATSGDYERYFEKNGVRYSHIIDPDTGYPARLCQSVTILAPSTYYADALATGVFVLGAEKGMKLVESLKGVEAVIIDSEGQILSSRGLLDLESRLR